MDGERNQKKCQREEERCDVCIADEGEREGVEEVEEEIFQQSGTRMIAVGRRRTVEAFMV